MLRIISTINKNDVESKLHEMKHKYSDKYFLDRYTIKQKEEEELISLEMIFKPLKNKIILHD